MNPFASLAALWTRRADTTPKGEWEIPLGLTPAEWAALKTLRADEGWDVWLRALDAALKFNGEALLSASTDENLHFHRGVIAGIRKAALLIDELKASEEDFINAKRRAQPRERAGRTTALYGSPGWSQPRQSGASRR